MNLTVKPFGWIQTEEVLDALQQKKGGRVGFLFFLFGGCGNFGSHCLIESFPSSEPKVLDMKGRLFSPIQVLALLKFYFRVTHYSCSGTVLCCSAGGWEEEEDADEIWIISSQCLAKPHFAGTAAFQCSSPPTQPAGLASGC